MTDTTAVPALLALLAALGFGLSDYVAGVASRRTASSVVAVVVQASGGLVALVVALVSGALIGGHTVVWGLVAGFGSGVGTLALYRGLAVGRMSVVAPVSAVVSAALPTLVGVFGGERPPALAWCGIALAIPATALVSMVGDSPPGTSSGLTEGLVAGLGFTVLFVGLHQAGTGNGSWPVALEMLSSLLVIGPVAWIATRGAAPGPGITGRGVLDAIGAGLLAGAAGAFFLASSGRGGLALAAVITSLYPAFTVILARVLLAEPIRKVQAVGLALAALSVAFASA
jgi:drug/metabolite transporter (DMT)-like permease